MPIKPPIANPVEGSDREPITIDTNKPKPKSLDILLIVNESSCSYLSLSISLLMQTILLS